MNHLCFKANCSENNRPKNKLQDSEIFIDGTFEQTKLYRDIEEYEKAIVEYEKRLESLQNSPNKEEVKELLFELPNQMTNVENIKMYFEKKIRALKLLINGTKNRIEIKKSEIRNSVLDEYRNKYIKYKEDTKKILDEIITSDEKASVKKAYITEIVRALKPEKPTQGELDDIANTNEEVMKLRQDLEKYENLLIELEDMAEALKIKHKRLENIFISVRAYKGILVEEMRLTGYQR